MPSTVVGSMWSEPPLIEALFALAFTCLSLKDFDAQYSCNSHKWVPAIQWWLSPCSRILRYNSLNRLATLVFQALLMYGSLHASMIKSHYTYKSSTIVYKSKPLKLILKKLSFYFPLIIPHLFCPLGDIGRRLVSCKMDVILCRPKVGESQLCHTQEKKWDIFNKKWQFNIDIELKFQITYQDFSSYIRWTCLIMEAWLPGWGQGAGLGVTTGIDCGMVGLGDDG